MTEHGTTRSWRGTLGAIPDAEGVGFRVWAPRPSSVELTLLTADGASTTRLERDGEYWVAHVPCAGPGARYLYRLDGDAAFPDPCSRGQPEGVHGPSEVVAPETFTWTDARWTPPAVSDLSIYECHVGTLTPEGAFDAAVGELQHLKDTGFTAIEVMPVASFPGRWNWGYDGVAMYAPAAVYGGPEGLRRLVDAAHGVGLAVILDVVYNHFGPDGNYTGLYSQQYATSGRRTPWGDALNFDGTGSKEVRRFFTENALHWVHEYHVDGFRFDATFGIQDASPVHYLAELSEALERHSRAGRRAYMIAETHENDVRYLRKREEGGFGFDAAWADDFHHIVRTIVSGEREGYYANYGASDDELAVVIRQGFYYEGQYDRRGSERRGTPAREQPWYQFVYCIQNHDQVGNRAAGERLNVTASHADFLAASLLLLLLPQTPLVFQGQEFLASTPFLYFTDHEPELGKLVTEGRRREFASFAAFSNPAARELIPDPQSLETFYRSKLQPDEGEYCAGKLCTRLYRELLLLRLEDAVLRESRTYRSAVSAGSAGKAVLVRIETPNGRRLIAANFGEEAHFTAPPGEQYRIRVHTGDPRFGGNDLAPTIEGTSLVLPPHSAAFLTEG